MNVYCAQNLVCDVCVILYYEMYHLWLLSTSIVITQVMFFDCICVQRKHTTNTFCYKRREDHFANTMEVEDKAAFLKGYEDDIL